ncbi:uncharacterized protein LOC106168570 [Lingula anatina]|uniref:Uncharacterized protein LOC106168570 n=1 Tax=Lingula anatina TaxID=7574 RepID=A0A2R2MJI8_LINAN|nr:uncharacterized protein LOC106168570 [Lingula anatina]|eukprot:XP_023930363.1 uncharacterized protein LOC106168570 [Lingula anatina]
MTVYEMLAIFNDMERADVFEILKDSVTEIKKQKENRSSLNYLPSGQQHTEACTCHSGQFARPACEDGIPIPPKRKKHRGSSPPDQLGVVSSSVDSDGDVMMDSLGNDVSGMQQHHHQQHQQQQQDMDIDIAMMHDLSSYGDPLLSDYSLHVCSNGSLPPVTSFLSGPENMALAPLESGSIVPLEVGLARTANNHQPDSYSSENTSEVKPTSLNRPIEPCKHPQQSGPTGTSIQFDSTYVQPTSFRRPQVVPNSDITNGNKPPFTYPRRHKPSKPDLKPLPTWQCDMRHRTLTHSLSEPKDMQPKEYKTVERKTRVLVTYTDDNEKHLKHMISLAKCLKDNQFAVIMDINKRENDELYDDMCGKIDKYFEKANYILICISPKYRQEMEEVDDEDDQFLSGSTVCHRLNTRYIYKLMQGEFRNNNSQNKRFIPVLFPNATKHDIPGWLLNTLYYRWPNEWMDLFMFLWRPDREFLDSKISSVKSKYDQDESLQSVPLSPQSTSRSGSQSSSCSSPGSAGRLPRIKKENT